MTADVDAETRKYLRELDTFGLPPEPCKIVPDEGYEASASVSGEFRQKLHQINIDHQKRVSGDSVSSGSGAALHPPAALPPSSRPRSRVLEPRGGETNSTHVFRTEMLRLGEKAEIKKNESDQLRESVLKATRPLNPWIEAQRYSPDPNQVYARALQASPLNVHTAASEKSDNHSSGVSLSPVSPISNSTTSTSTSGSSNGSLSNSGTAGGAGRWARLDGTYSAKLVNAEVANAQTRAPEPKTILRTYRPGSGASSSNGKAETNQQMPPLSRGKVFVDPPSPERRSTITRGLRFLEELEEENRVRSHELSDAFLRHVSVTPAKVVGKCGKCFEPVFDNNQVTYALDSLFHDSCFVCWVCRESLRGRRFYQCEGKTYCEQDYFHTGVLETAPQCAACHRPVTDMVLQAIGKSFHPTCFRCQRCGESLDGVPFALDGEGRVFCMDDYERLFSPNCAVCHKAIKAANDFGQIVRVVAMDKEYHIDCYRCEGCGIQLTNERDKQCFPLNDHLLCRACHREWSRSAPVTDL